MCHFEFDNFHIPKGFSDEIGDGINKCDYFGYCNNEMWGKHLEDLCNSVNQYFQFVV